ncbi:MAG: anhydro-N-acetylmuramic acid kinase [Planctomycetes bacterium]|nr:anhydro-N-acetylmuramic acid kinase [Planctomycetota bacterium]
MSTDHLRACFVLPADQVDQPRLVLGMSSGTSADGLDLALVRIVGAGLQRQVEFIAGAEVPLQAHSRAAIRRAAEWKISELAHWHYHLAVEFGQLAADFLAQNGISAGELTLVGSHGQTVYHHDGDFQDGTLQIADPAVIAYQLSCPVIADFRWNDIAAGGQGAPISPFADWMLHHAVGQSIVILNLGGIANLTLLRGTEPPAAWDSGPANGPLDALMQAHSNLEFDRDGKMAAQGKIDPNLLTELQSDPFFRRRLPRSTGLERFGASLTARIRQIAPATSLPDQLRTCCALAAWAVAQSLEIAVGDPSEKISLPIYVCGGGGHNPVLAEELQFALPQAKFHNYSELHGNPDLREAQAFALLADACFLGEYSAWPSTTGARHPVILGKIVPSCI